MGHRIARAAPHVSAEYGEIDLFHDQPDILRQSSYLQDKSEKEQKGKDCMPYLFQDTERAARRLHLVADVFAFSSRPFLHTEVGAAPKIVIDLGCGPGYTTRLLAEVTQCAQAISLDSSEHFLSQALEVTR